MKYKVRDYPTRAYKLEKVRELVKANRWGLTGDAHRDAAGLGFELSDVKQVLLDLRLEHFFKSMTSEYDYKQRLDVYRYADENILIYLKFVSTDEVLVTSFKEK